MDRRGLCVATEGVTADDATVFKERESRHNNNNKESKFFLLPGLVDRLSSGSSSLSFLSLVVLVSSTVSDRSRWLFQPVYNFLCTRARQTSVGIAVDSPDRGIQKPVGLKDLFPLFLLGPLSLCPWSLWSFLVPPAFIAPSHHPLIIEFPDIPPVPSITPAVLCALRVTSGSTARHLGSDSFHFTFIYIYNRFSRP